MSTLLARFPGVVSQEVQPNPKCNGCLHFDGQRGATGVCVIGLRPWLCGEGESPNIGYAPVKAVGPHVLDDQAVPARAPAAPDQDVSELHGGSGGEIQMRHVVLGDQHASLVKALVSVTERREREQCRFHKSNAFGRSPITGVMVQGCTCRSVETETVAKALASKLTNAERAVLDMPDVVGFVDGIRKGLTPTQVAIEDIKKGIYGDDWLCQFKGTALFKEAYALCEEELSIREAQLKKRIEDAKRRKAALAADKVNAVDRDWDAEYVRDEKLRLEKRRLQLRLAKLTAPPVTKSDDAVDKGLKWSVNDYAGTASVKHPKVRYKVEEQTHGFHVGGTHVDGESFDLGHHASMKAAQGAATKHFNTHVSPRATKKGIVDEFKKQPAVAGKPIKVSKEQRARGLATVAATMRPIVKKSGEGSRGALAKSEGSRGGKIIGHTKSGKPVYEASNRLKKLGQSVKRGDASDAETRAFDAQLLHHVKKHPDFTDADLKDAASINKKHKGDDDTHQFLADHVFGNRKRYDFQTGGGNAETPSEKQHRERAKSHDTTVSDTVLSAARRSHDKNTSRGTRAGYSDATYRAARKHVGSLDLDHAGHAAAADAHEREYARHAATAAKYAGASGEVSKLKFRTSSTEADAHAALADAHDSRTGRR